MTTEVERISDQLHRAFYGEAWHGPAVMVLLNEVGAAKASARPAPKAHTIWEIVNHISAWKDAVRRRLLGEDVQLDGEMDWPPVKDTTESAWRKTLEDLKRRHDNLETVVAGLKESNLDRPWANGKSTIYFLTHGSIQHDLYHAGQIALLIRAM
jgi:uncharacterized damage-inducible protein DinB